jgi:hypothetical protein
MQKKWEGHVDKMSSDRIPEKYYKISGKTKTLIYSV